MQSNEAEPAEEGRKRVTITIEDETHRKGQELARLDKRSFSHFVEWLIEQEDKRKQGVAA